MLPDPSSVFFAPGALWPWCATQNAYEKSRGEVILRCLGGILKAENLKNYYIQDATKWVLFAFQVHKIQFWMGSS